MTKKVIREKVIKIATERLQTDEKILAGNMTLVDLDADSLDFVEFLFEVEDEYDISIDSSKLRDPSMSVSDIIDNIVLQISSATD